MCALQASAAEDSFRLQRVQSEAENDVQYQDLKRQIQSGFPESETQLPDHLLQFWTVRHDLTVSDDEFVLYGTRLLIHTALRPQILSELHKDHRGIDSTREVIDQPIQQHSQHCEQCFSNLSTQQREPLHHLPRPARAWEFVSSDLFHSHGKGICYTDWYSGWFSYTFPIPSSSAAHVISIIRHWFTNTAVPDVLFSDQGPPYNSEDFQGFLMRWGVAYKCSSAVYPQGNA